MPISRRSGLALSTAGASACCASAGVKAAIIDTGIDYGHADFGGPGTTDYFTSNDSTVIEPSHPFPTSKVVGGYDFVGDNYNAADPAHLTPTPDPDPLDCAEGAGDSAGHGTHVDDMVPTRWSDWSRDADAAYATLAKRVSKVVVMGLSMGGTLTLWLAAQHPETAGIVCVNPATFPFAGEMVDAVRGILESGTEIIPGIGSDIADPDVTENAYPGTPIRPLISFVEEGLAPLSSR